MYLLVKCLYFIEKEQTYRCKTSKFVLNFYYKIISIEFILWDPCKFNFHWKVILNSLIVPVGRVFANESVDMGSIPGRVILKTLKMVLDTSLLNTQQYKVRIKGKLKQPKERSSALPYTSV